MVPMPMAREASSDVLMKPVSTLSLMTMTTRLHSYMMTVGVLSSSTSRATPGTSRNRWSWWLEFKAFLYSRSGFPGA